ncbi:MAG TPA: hypothetical protein VFK87_10725 [Steroidobacteraceae bacterium]|nr:hypothetical protein [Steroidobacteraceae bacterium]
MWRLAWLAWLAAVVAAGCDAGINGDVTAGKGGASTVNGSVHVPAGEHIGPVGTVNGSIQVGDNAVVDAAHTVNGAVELGARATADSVTAVNGPVTLEAGAHVTHSVTTVNGSLSLGNGADVGGAIRNVNGRIELAGAHVGGGLRTVDGDIDISGASRVEGGILVQKSGGWFNLYSRPPRIVIGPGAVVEGDLRFERDVRLYVSDRATVGPVSGATAIRFSGDRPPG